MMNSVSSICVVMISMSLLSWMASMSHSLSPPPHVSRSQFLSRLALSSVFLAPSPSLSLDADAYGEMGKADRGPSNPLQLVAGPCR